MTDAPNPAPQPAPQPEVAANEVNVKLDARAMGIAVYALYLITLITAGTAAIAGVILAYVVRKDAPEWLRSHYEFQIRTFWIGLAATVIGTVLVVVGIGILILIAAGLWFLIRAVAGLGQLLNNKPYPNPQSWLI